MAPETQGQKRENSNIVFIGNKPLVNYVKSVLIQFNKQNSQEVIIRSRGKFISKAVDVSEIAKRALEQKVKIKAITTASEQFETKGKTTNISTMDITLTK
jgi:DNA-binding protein